MARRRRGNDGAGDYHQRVGRRAAEAAIARGISAELIALYLGWTRESVEYFFNGQAYYRHLEVLTTVARVLEVPVKELQPSGSTD